jgi:hypothetical protein
MLPRREGWLAQAAPCPKIHKSIFPHTQLTATSLAAQTVTLLKTNLEIVQPDVWKS